MYNKIKQKAVTCRAMIETWHAHHMTKKYRCEAICKGMQISEKKQTQAVINTLKKQKSKERYAKLNTLTPDILKEMADLYYDYCHLSYKIRDTYFLKKEHEAKAIEVAEKIDVGLEQIEETQRQNLWQLMLLETELVKSQVEIIEEKGRIMLRKNENEPS